MKANFELMADYNRWMNEKLYEVVSGLSATELHQDRGAFFGSIMGSLNHILVADIIWLKRYTKHSYHFEALNVVATMPLPTKLDAMLYEDFAALRQARAEMDKVIIEFANEVTEEALAADLHYKNTQGKTFSRKFGFLVHHLFNHQTHHRGQITTLLSQIGIDMGETDLLARIPISFG
ncbi:damage-inducible protein DinB [Pseudoalteromonas sp. A22]|uniref:DinB family protein n=1 Tax=Pseudoalteromonas sp. A22 TaxID=327511 RepID=UPI001BAC5A7A|nr:DinB family protein [Pseudoalteromonas sp. A22]QUI61784.1 damage-inducible protein DinB [Pseudoalteromonas sp. A22]